MSSVFPISVPIALDPVPYANESPYIVNSTNAAQDTVDTNPSDLADFFIDGLDIDAPTNSSQNMPEPGTLLLFGTALAGLYARRGRARGRHGMA